VQPRALAALAAVAARLEAAGVEWLLAGSAGRRLLGFSARPRDIDLETSEDRADAGAAALGLRLRHDDAGGRSSWRARGTLAGMPVDLTAGLRIEGPGGVLEPDFGAQRTWACAREVAGWRILAAPAEEALARALVAADWAVVERFVAAAPAGWAPRPAYLALRLASAARAAR
jgi:hypothetical protein